MTVVERLLCERMDDLRMIAVFAMAQGDEVVEDAGVRVMLTLDHPDLITPSDDRGKVRGRG